MFWKPSLSEHQGCKGVPAIVVIWRWRKIVIIFIWWIFNDFAVAPPRQEVLETISWYRPKWWLNSSHHRSGCALIMNESIHYRYFLIMNPMFMFIFNLEWKWKFNWSITMRHSQLQYTVYSIGVYTVSVYCEWVYTVYRNNLLLLLKTWRKQPT